MSDYIESLFEGVDILIDRRLESLAYDKTDICTIIDSSKSKNGEYKVTNGSVTYLAYSDSDKFRNGEQVRVSVPKGDFSQRKYIIGKYVTDDSVTPITYVSPLESVIDLSGNLISDSKSNKQYGIIANGADNSRTIYSKEFSDKEFESFNDTDICNSINLQADFKTLFQNQTIAKGTYGLRIVLYVKPSKSSKYTMTRVLELSNSDMFGNPYNFTLYSTQAKSFDISSFNGVIIGFDLEIYQSNDFKHGLAENLIIPNKYDDILVKNIILNFGSNILTVENNTLKIYTTNSPDYKYNPHNESTNLKTINLLWYNSDEDNRYIGFSDGIYSTTYDELNYLKIANANTRLLAQKNRENIPGDEMSLSLAANIEEAAPLIQNATKIISQDLIQLLRELYVRFEDNEDLAEPVDDLLHDSTKALTIYTNEILSLLNGTETASGLVDQYQSVLQYGYKVWVESEKLDKWSDISNENYHQDILQKFKDIQKAIDDLFVSKLAAVNNKYTGYKSIKEAYEIRSARLLATMWGYLGMANKEYTVVTKEYYHLNKYFPKDFFTKDYKNLMDYKDKTKPEDYPLYVEPPLEEYANKYCIYWYRYEAGYQATDGDTIMPDGWRRLSGSDFSAPHNTADGNGKNIGLTGKYYYDDSMPNKFKYVLEKQDNYSNSRKYYSLQGEKYKEVNIDKNSFEKDKYYVRVCVNEDGDAIHAPKLSGKIEQINRYMQNDCKEENYVAVLFYNHNMYKSNELTFVNLDDIPNETTSDQGDILIFEHIKNSTDNYQSYAITNYLMDLTDESKIRQIRCHYDGLLVKDNAFAEGQIFWYVPRVSTMITVDLDDLLENKGFTLDEDKSILDSEDNYIEANFTGSRYKKNRYYVKKGSKYVICDDEPNEDNYHSVPDEDKTYYEKNYAWYCFYKKIKTQEKENSSTLPPEEQYIYCEEGSSIDNRDFWYKIKPYYEATAANNEIQCEFIKREGIDPPVTGTQLFSFGVKGTSGTKYTLSITNAGSNVAATGEDGLGLKAELKDFNNETIDLPADLKISWQKKFLKILGDNDSGIAVTKATEKEYFVETPPGYCGIITASASILLSGTELAGTSGDTTGKVTVEDAGTHKERKVDLVVQHPIPYSVGSYYIQGPTSIIYNSLGTLDNTSMFNTPYKLFAKTSQGEYKKDQEIQNIEWTIDYYKVSGGSLVKTTDDFYNSYMPKLNNDNLVPAPLYLSNLDCYAIVTAKLKDTNTVYWKQPIIILQNRYSSSMLNDWDGTYQVNEKNGTILGSMFGAGRKADNNTFEGVLMGNVGLEAGGVGFAAEENEIGYSNQSGLGIYGFESGEQSFGFNIDGTAFLGKAGRGRIIFNGNHGVIASANWFAGIDTEDEDGNIVKNGGRIYANGTLSPSNAGMCINLEEGHIDAYNFKLTSKNIYLNSNPSEESQDYYFMIGSDGKHTFPGQINQERSTGYLALDKEGNLEIKVNSLYLTEQLGGANLLNQTLPTKTVAQYKVDGDGEIQYDKDAEGKKEPLYQLDGNGNVICGWDVSNTGNPVVTQWTTLSKSTIQGMDTIYSGHTNEANYTCILIQRHTETESEAVLKQQVTNLKKKKIYTVSGYARRALWNGNDEYDFEVSVSNSSSIAIVDNKNKVKITNADWTYFEYTVKLNDTATDAVITFKSNVNFYLYHAKFELGSIATDWELSEWDVKNGAKLEKDNYDKYLTQDRIFKKLITNPNNGEQMVGIWMLDGQDGATGHKELYINATYMATGILRSSNWEGTVRKVDTGNLDVYGRKIYTYEILSPPKAGLYLNLDAGKMWAATFELNAWNETDKKGIYLNSDPDKSQSYLKVGKDTSGCINLFLNDDNKERLEIFAVQVEGTGDSQKKKGFTLRSHPASGESYFRIGNYGSNELRFYKDGDSDKFLIQSDQFKLSTSSIYLSDTSSSFTINGQSRDVVLRMGTGFGVSSGGTLYTKDAVIHGNIDATGGEIGGWTINENSLSGSGTISGGTISGSNISCGGTSGGTVTVEGSITATEGKIGGWTISDNNLTCNGITINGTDGSISCADTYTLAKSGVTIQKGSIEIGKDGTDIAFKVDTNGNVTIKKGTITVGDIQIKSTGFYDTKNNKNFPSQENITVWTGWGTKGGWGKISFRNGLLVSYTNTGLDAGTGDSSVFNYTASTTNQFQKNGVVTETQWPMLYPDSNTGTVGADGKISLKLSLSVPFALYKAGTKTSVTPIGSGVYCYTSAGSYTYNVYVAHADSEIVITRETLDSKSYTFKKTFTPSYWVDGGATRYAAGTKIDYYEQEQYFKTGDTIDGTIKITLS